MADRVGQQLGNYRLTRRLGVGGFAEVYHGEHIHLQTPAAIKILHVQLTAQHLQDFLQEARIIARLRHLHIIPIIDYAIDNTATPPSPFIVMAYAAQGSLRDLHPRGSVLPLQTILSYINQIASALQHAHNEQLIHRDVKPENMLVESGENLLLSDFGIAVDAHSTSSLKTQNELGSVHYMAPEHINGKPRPASDQYSLGTVVYEWLTGDWPFHGSSWIEIAMKQLSSSPPPLRGKTPTISPAIEQVVLQALAKDPHQRFPSIQAFAKALEQAGQAQRLPPVALPTIHSAPTQLNTAQLLMPGVVELTHQVGKEFMPVTSGSQIAHVSLQVKVNGLQGIRQPLNIALVINHSGSMRGEKLRTVKEAAMVVVDHLEPTDYISVIMFDDTCQVLIPSMLANDKPGMKAAIDRIHDAGGIKMSLGMEQGLNELKRRRSPRWNALNRMLLLTDGVTYGDADRCRQLARDISASDSIIYPLGIGRDWNQELLDTIGLLSGGSPAAFLHSPSGVMNTLQVIAQTPVTLYNVVLRLRLPIGVSFKKVYGRNVDLSRRQIDIPLGRLKTNQIHEELMELLIAPRKEGLFRMAQAEISYEIPILGIAGEQARDDITVTFSANTQKVIQVNAQVMSKIAARLAQETRY